MPRLHSGVVLALLGGGLAACGSLPGPADASTEVDGGVVRDWSSELDAGTDAGSVRPPDPFADRVVRFTPGPTAGFGQDGFPNVVLGSPEGGGSIGSLHVLSLGKEGAIILEFTDIGVIDGPGADLLIFENPFPGWTETGVVAVSDDGTTWSEFPCQGEARDAGTPGCAGLNPVQASSTNGISATDPAVAGGDAFDLASLGVPRARFVRIRDSGHNVYGGLSGGFDLDAVSVVNGSPISEWTK